MVVIMKVTVFLLGQEGERYLIGQRAILINLNKLEDKKKEEIENVVFRLVR